MATTLASVLPLVREHYAKNILDLWNEYDKDSSPLFAAMESKSMANEGGGRKMIVPIEYNVGTAVGPDFTVARAKATGSTAGSTAARTRWEADACDIDSFARWDRSAMLAAQGKGSDEVFQMLEREMVATTGRIKKRLVQASLEQGYGRVGTITAITTTTVTFSDSVINRLEIGDDIVAAAVHTSGALRSATAVRVTGINMDTGVATVSADPTALGWIVGDTVCYEGYRNVTTPLMPFGLPAWVPATAPGATAFCGVDRSGVPQLGGLRKSASGLDHAQAFIRGSAEAFKAGTKIDYWVCSARDYEILASDRDATKTVQIAVGKNEIGFSGVAVQTARGLAPIVPDMYMEQGTAWGGPFNDKRFAPYIAHNNDLVNVDDEDGNDFVRVSDARAYEMRMYFRGQMFFPAPGKFIALTSLPTV